MNKLTIVVGSFAVNCLIIWDDPDAACVVDPGGDAHLITDALEKHGLRPAAYLITHGHMDHISALKQVHERYPAPCHMHSADQDWAFTPINSIPTVYPPPQPLPAGSLHQAVEGATVQNGGLNWTVLHTPGHTPGCVCYHEQSRQLLLTGDTLFQGSAGRTDLPGGNPAILRQSLARLATLPEATEIIPGHGPATTLLTEKQFNPFLAR